jgi:hypothetical protein
MKDKNDANMNSSHGIFVWGILVFLFGKRNIGWFIAEIYIKYKKLHKLNALWTTISDDVLNYWRQKNKHKSSLLFKYLVRIWAHTSNYMIFFYIKCSYYIIHSSFTFCHLFMCLNLFIWNCEQTNFAHICE